jgi:radical SAM superfamily enzyme YgiQ (UPF0313 family)
MKTTAVAFVAFEQFDNLGIGYLSSVLAEAGFKNNIIDFRIGKKEILRRLRRINPIVVGFSVIFQYYIYEFGELISFLRQKNINCHFTAGGQFASLRTKEIFEIIPSLDSVVKFEGEYTFLELVSSINQGRDWRYINGIAYQHDENLIINPLRSVETNLDKFPFPFRFPLKEYALEKKFATILAGRGCLNNCKFCYIREYYLNASSPLKRIRRPEEVVREMEFLYFKKNCSVFLFQDDDFPVKNGNDKKWIERFCGELDNKGLVNRVMWKINCRPDEVGYKSFRLMKEHGLFLVFLGIEDGTDEGLKRLNKHMSVEKCYEGINILKKLKIGFDYGFMLFQPSSTFGSVKDNLNFLSNLCGDGYVPVTFLKMMPYSATPIEKELQELGRLKGIPGFLDYDFIEDSLNNYYKFITENFDEWLRDPDGLVNITKWARNYISVFSHYYDLKEEVQTISMNIKNTVAESNLFMLNNLKELAALFESGNYSSGNYSDLNCYRENINLNHNLFKEQVNIAMSRLLEIVERQKILKSVPVFL